MEWKQITNWYMESDSGYRISKAGTGSRLKYGAWRPGSKVSDHAITYTSRLENAKKACEEHKKGESK